MTKRRINWKKDKRNKKLLYGFFNGNDIKEENYNNLLRIKIFFMKS